MEATSPTTATVALDEIQGNLAGFFKPFHRFVFLHFRDKASAQAFIRVVVREIDTCDTVMDFKRRLKWAKSHGHADPAPERWFNLVLSARGLDRLEAPERELFEQPFRDGMRARAGDLGDKDLSDPAQWVVPFQEEIHAMAILAADNAEDLEKLHTELRRHANAHAHPVDELGQVDGQARPDPNHGHEHFGFLDGISQPGIQGLTEDPKPGQEMIEPGEFVLGYPRRDEQPPSTPPPGYAPPPPPPAFPSWAKDGSFVVMRRLRQDVKGFNDFIGTTSAQEGLRADLLEAKLVGRYKSGAPLERTRDEAADFDPQAADPAVADPSILGDDKINNFAYQEQDADGHLVPRAAHIRKTYLRDEDPPGKIEAERRRILRRGIAYGPEFQESESPYPGAEPPPVDQDRGLVFISYQASIERQFEFIQTQWANIEDFPQPGDGRDPIISQDVPDPKFSMPPDKHLVLQRWVITTGGEYFFSPSISALKLLAGE